MALTKADIIQTVSEESGFSKKQSMETVETLLEIIKRTLENGEDVLISGFGKFCVKEKRQRRGRNPATGSAMTLSARRVVTFKCSGRLRGKINDQVN
ncbi:MAG: DNA-binding protein [Deltaproteobacteria bacterium SG8_13]|nr:MAG: DNA-binding protein [Deltaproteobacteria bacterium SG8_13]